MRFIWNLIGTFGLFVLVLLIIIAVRWQPPLHRLADFDSRVLETYADMAKKVLETGNGAEATVWKMPVQDGLTAEDVEQTMKYVANELNIKLVGELPLYREVEAISGEPFRFVQIYMFCNAMTAARMLDYSDAFSAYLPCRITLVEDTSGKLWLYTLNMDLMIHGGTPLPEELNREALQVKDTILAIMRRGASGEF